MKKIYLILLGIVFITVIIIKPTYCVKAEGLGFTVEPLFTVTQIDQDIGHYYIATEPGKEQEILAEIRSTQIEEVKIKLSANNAFTQDNGQIGYTEDLDKLDKTLQNPISSMINFEKDTITVKDFEVKKIKIKVKPPKESYPGIKAGGIIFTQINDKEKKAGVDTDYAYRIGIITSESGDIYNDSKTLNLINAKPVSKGGRKVVEGILQNPEPKLLVGLSMNATIIDAKSKKTIKKSTAENYTMAPNSNMPIDFDWGLDKLKPGKYVMKIEAKNGTETWNLTKEFEITSAQSNEINSKSPYQLITPKWLKILSVILGTLLLINGSIIFTRKNKYKKELKKLSLDKKRNRKKGRRTR